MAERWRDVCGVRIAPPELRFTNTVLGSCYRAALTVQNLRADACHLRLLPPREPQFKLIVENPDKPIASGLQVKAVVEYTPKCVEDLQDKLTLLVEDDVVHIPLLGLIPYCDLEVESEVNFGEMIANNKLVTKEINVANHGTTSGVFRVTYDGVVLLNIKPTRGVVKPKSVRKIKVDICTDVPGVIKEMMKVELESRGFTEVWIKGVVVEQVLKVLGVSCGKALKCINFGPLYFGTSKTEKIYLYNESSECVDWVAVLEDNAIGEEMGTDLQGNTDAVLHDLSLKNKDVDVSTLILCFPNQGTLPPHEKSLITICFSPEKFEREFEVNDASLIQDYVLFLRFEAVGERGDCLQNLSGGATATTRSFSRHVDLALMGSGFPVILTFKPGRVIHFKDCYLGEQAQVVCTMKNESEFLPVTFSFRKTAHFNISPERGKLKRKSEKEVMISFSPHQIGAFEMKQIIDIIGTRVDKNNVQVLKTKSFHQIYLTLLGVCKSKQTSIVFTINPGLTPLISNATGQFAVRGTGQLSVTAPVAILKSTQTQIHTHRKNKNCKDDALIAFPNDRAASLRPSEWNKTYRQLFIYNTPVSIGIKPAEGLKSPKISIADFPKEKPQSRMLPLDDNCLLTSRELAAIISKSTNKGVWSWLSPMPYSTKEKEDCHLILTLKQLHQIFIGPSTIDFGEVCVYSTTTKELHIINNLSVHIWIQIEIEVEELRETSPLSQVVPPLTKTHIPVVFETTTVGMFKRSLSYKINNRHIGHVLVVARAMPIELQLSTRELILTPVPGCLAGTEFRRTVRVCNPRNYPASFSWKSVTGDRKSAFTIKPIRGFVEAYSDVECEVVWHPGFNTLETGQFILSVRKGNSIHLKCFAKVLDTNPLPGMKITPSVGVIPVGGVADLKISFSPKSHMNFDKKVEVAVRNAAELTLRIGGFSEITEIGIDVEVFEFGGLAVGATKSIPFLLQNKGQSCTRVEFDFSTYRDFKLNAEDNSDDAKNDLPKLEGFFYHGVHLRGKGSWGLLVSHLNLEKSYKALYNSQAASVGADSLHMISGSGFVLGTSHVISSQVQYSDVIDHSRSNPNLYSITLKGGSSLQCFLILVPKKMAAYDFILPIATPRASTPPPVPPVSLKRGAVAPHPPPEAPALPLCKVRALVTQQVLEFSSMEFKFEQHSSNMCSSTARGSMNSQNLVLKNLTKETLIWKLNFDDADKNIEDGIFRFSLKRGCVYKEKEVSITVSFHPPCPGTYTSEISMYLDDDPSQYVLKLSGTLRMPKIDFHPPFLMLMPVPLGVETEAVVTIIPQDFLRQSRIRVKLPELELADGTRTLPFSVQFPEGQDIFLSSDGTTNELTCRVSFSSSKPMSFLGEMLFIDQEENRLCWCGMVFNVSKPYLYNTVSLEDNQDFSTGEIVLQPCFTPRSSSHSYSTSSLGVASDSIYEDSSSESTTCESESNEQESDESEEIREGSESDSQGDGRGNKRELSFFPDEDKEEYTFFQKTLKAVKSWFTLFGWSKGQNPISVPHSLRRSQGAYLSHVMPEFLLSPEDYEIWTEVNTGLRCFTPEVKRGSMRSSGKLSGRPIFVLEDRTFETMSKRAWTDVLLQIYKYKTEMDVLERDFNEGSHK
ncbi:PREDICTED: calponin homology domain-containing protein 2 [Pseudopodoces humilis]|uniref:calponin homology domain-containing protein 2 n=1 Tax=Pseudopodoces humilis TaxID=181119 RepID=UPI0006B870D2|nr:PREDICTED: calponin homology domain-containing protein 2 [Pseudopodoces humilis]